MNLEELSLSLKENFSTNDSPVKKLKEEVLNTIYHSVFRSEDFIQGKFCGGSYLRDIIEMGLNGEIGEKYRLLKKYHLSIDSSKELILNDFIDLILKEFKNKN